MLSHISYNIAKYFSSKNLIPFDEIDSYAFGYEIILSELIGWGMIAVIMLLTSCFAETICFCVTFVLLRIHAGGYHANSHLSCNLLFCLDYSLFLVVCRYIPISFINVIVISAVIINAIVMFKYSPIQHENNVHSMEQLKFHRKRSLTYSLIFTLLSITVLITKFKVFGLYVALGMLSVDCSMITARLLNKNSGNKI